MVMLLLRRRQWCNLNQKTMIWKKAVFFGHSLKNSKFKIQNSHWENEKALRKLDPRKGQTI